MNEAIETLKTMSPWILGPLLGLGFVLVFFFFTKTLLRICGPNEALILSGLFASSEVQGQKRRFKPVVGGRCISLPGVTQVDRLSLALMEVPIAVRNAYSQGGIAMNVEANGNVKISSDDRIIGNAVERFLNRDVAEIRRVAKETLEGHLRGVIATLTPEQVNEDRLTFAEALARESEEDLAKLGLHLDTLKILHVSDELGYLDATGRKAIAAVVREAEIAESDAKRAAEQAESENTGRADVTKAETESQVARLRNDLRKIKADLEAKVRTEEEITIAAAREARAKAEQRLQQIRAELEGIRLQVEQVLPAEAQAQAEAYLARGRAALIRERGRAVSEALGLLYGAWKAAGPNAKQIALIEDYEKLIAAAAKGVDKIKVKNLSMIDSGAGRTLPNYVGAYPEMLGAVFAAVEQATGIDIPGSVSGQGGKA
jgi:flotillin